MDHLYELVSHVMYDKYLCETKNGIMIGAKSVVELEIGANQNVGWTVPEVPLVPNVPVRNKRSTEGSENLTPKKCG